MMSFLAYKFLSAWLAMARLFVLSEASPLNCCYLISTLAWSQRPVMEIRKKKKEQLLSSRRSRKFAFYIFEGREFHSWRMLARLLALKKTESDELAIVYLKVISRQTHKNFPWNEHLISKITWRQILHCLVNALEQTSSCQWSRTDLAFFYPSIHCMPVHELHLNTVS